MQLGPFNLVETIGRGGMATVWSGVHAALGTPVAVKFMRPGEDRVRETLLFLNEARALAAMHHPGIVQVYDAGLCPSDAALQLPGVEAMSPYFVMEYAGRSILRTEDIGTWQTARQLLLSLLDALAHAHAREVVHRDIKPGNILVDDDGVVRLTDFGISQFVGRQGRDGVGVLRGTPAYMAPESIATSAPPEGPWTDLYSVGCLAYWMTTGAPPFTGPIDELLSAQLREEPPELRPRFEVPVGFAEVCRKLLRKEPQARFTRAADAARALAKLPAIVDGSTPPPLPVQVVPTMPLATIVEQVAESELDTDPGQAEAVRAPRPPEDWRYPRFEQSNAVLATGPGLLDFRVSALIGRREERDRLWSLLHDSWSGADISVAICGPEGIGRHALTEWFARRAHEVGAATVLRFEDGLHESMASHLEAWCRRVGGPVGIEAFYRRSGSWKGTEWERQHLRRLAIEGEISDAVLPAVFSRWTASISRERVVMLLPSAELAPWFEQMRSSQPGRRILVVAANTATLPDVEITLRPMETRAIQRLLSERLGFSDNAASGLASSAEGNPGAAMRWARNAIRDGLVERTANGLDLRPESLETLIQQAEDWQHRLEAVVGGQRSRVRALQATAMVEDFVYRAEFEAICEAVGAEANSLLAHLFESGILLVDGEKVQFSHPDIRHSTLVWRPPTDDAYRSIVEAYDALEGTPRRTRIATRAGLEAGIFDAEYAQKRAREFRVLGRVDDAITILETARQLRGAPGEDLALIQELVECHLSSQSYTDARRLLDATRGRNPSLEALELFLMHRDGTDVREELLSVDTANLSETATRMVAYAWTDLGEYDGARGLLVGLEPELDPPGKHYALSRLAFLELDWDEAVRYGLRAARGFVSRERLDGRLAALDLVASARIELGQLESAIGDYRGILRDAERLQVPTWPYRSNLAVALLRRDAPPTEVDRHLQSVIADTIEAGRRDVEHYARAAQVLYALEHGKLVLAEKRLDALEEMGVGPWMVGDVARILEQVSSEAVGTSIHQRVADLVVEVEQALE